MQQVLCPQCGAPVQFKSAASVMAVCGACRSTLLKDAESVRRIGEMSEVLEDYSPIQIGTAGKYDGKHFDVVGRLQMRYDDGFWSEWYVWFDDGSDGWLSDASGQYAVTRLRADKGKIPPLPAFDTIKPAYELRLDSKVFHASDIRSCRSIAGQGELPFVVGDDGWEAKVADFRALNLFLTLDYSDGPEPQIYVGKAIDLDDLQRDSLRAEHLIEESAGSYAGAIKALECPNCGGPISFAAAVATQVVCPACRAVVDCSGDTAQVIEKQRKVTAFKTTLELGDKAKINGDAYTLIGLMQCTNPDPEERSAWVEYLLYSPKKGFLWLVESEEGWDRVRVCDRWPAQVNASRYQYAGNSYEKRYDYSSKVLVALGAFNWRVKQGDVTEITDYAFKTNKLTRETTGAEMGWSVSTRVKTEDIASWFSRPEILKTVKKGNKPTTLGGLALIAIIVMVIFNADAIFDGDGLGTSFIGLVFLWLPTYIQSKFNRK